MTKLLNVSELANYLNVNPGWVYKHSEQGKLPYIQVGKYLRFNLDEVLKELNQKAAPQGDL